MDVLNIAVETAKEKNILTMVIASTTGDTAYRLSNIVKGERFRIIVVTHDEGMAPEYKRFREDIRLQLLARGVSVYTHNLRWGILQKIAVRILSRLNLLAWRKHLKEIKEKYGTGIKVCNIIAQMLKEAKVLKNDRFIAIAGRKKGADSAAIFSIRPQNKWPILEEVIVNKMN